MAPSGREDDSASTRSSVSPMRVAGAERAELIGLLNALGLLAELVKPHLEAVRERSQKPLVEDRRAAASRVPEASAMDMVRESSTSTATTFCCGLSVATLSAGCQSRNSSSATMAVSSSQMAIGRSPLSMPWLRRMCQNSMPAAARMAAASSHSGHGVRNTKWPF